MSGISTAMKKSEFEGSSTGTLVATIGNQWAFDPADLPPPIDMNDVAQALADATLALGELNGIGRTLTS